MSKRSVNLAAYDRVTRQDQPDPIELVVGYDLPKEELRFLRMSPESYMHANARHIKARLCADLAEHLVDRLRLSSDTMLMQGGERVEIRVTLNDTNAYSRWRSVGFNEGRDQEREWQQQARPYGLDEIYE